MKFVNQTRKLFNIQCAARLEWKVALLLWFLCSSVFKINNHRIPSHNMQKKGSTLIRWTYYGAIYVSVSLHETRQCIFVHSTVICLLVLPFKKHISLARCSIHLSLGSFLYHSPKLCSCQYVHYEKNKFYGCDNQDKGIRQNFMVFIWNIMSKMSLPTIS